MRTAGIVIAIIIVLIILGRACGSSGGGGDSGGGSTTASEPTTSSAEQTTQSKEPATKQKQAETPATVAIGQPATVADASWTVANAYPTTQLNDQFGLQPPKQGNFVVVDFTFTNNGTEAKTLTHTIINLFDSAGRKSSPDTDTFSYIPNDKDVFINQVNPGVTKDGEVIFSVAPDASGFKLELSNTNFLKSDKANVDLGF